MGYNSIPPRWEEYSKVGKLIPGTQIIPFKVPLRKEICNNLKDARLRFTVEDLIEECKDLKLSMVIDLTQTNRFYNGEELEKYNIKHVKFSTKGGGIMPSNQEVKTFCDTIHNHLEKNPDAVVGVHCTHGLNRTGYFICRYMIDYLGFSGSKSVNLFEDCRGHTFDRDNYREFLMNRIPNNELKKSNSNANSEDKADEIATFNNSSPAVHGNSRKRRFSEDKSGVSCKNDTRSSRSFNDGAKRVSRHDYTEDQYEQPRTDYYVKDYSKDYSTSQYEQPKTGYYDEDYSTSQYEQPKTDYYDEDYGTSQNHISNYASHKVEKERKIKRSSHHQKNKYSDPFQVDHRNKY